MRLDYKGSKDKLFFTSDPHFFHGNIIKFCNRPFNNNEEQAEELIRLWNEKVPIDGIVFVAGDFFFTGNIQSIESVLYRLNGTIYWIMGNHDYQNRLDREVFSQMPMINAQADIITLLVREDNNKQFVISHYPYMYWQSGFFHLHGHVHGGPNSKAAEKVPEHHMRYDIGVDNNNYAPISYDELMEIFDKKSDNYDRSKISEEDK